jgi:hypothetical protein
LLARPLHPPQGNPIGTGKGAATASGSANVDNTPAATSAPTSDVNLPKWGVRGCLAPDAFLSFFIAVPSKIAALNLL